MPATVACDFHHPSHKHAQPLALCELWLAFQILQYSHLLRSPHNHYTWGLRSLL